MFVNFDKNLYYKTFKFDEPSTNLSEESTDNVNDGRIANLLAELKVKLKIIPPNKKLLYLEKNPIKVNEKTSVECNKSIKIVHKNLLEDPKLGDVVVIPQEIDDDFSVTVEILLPMNVNAIYSIKIKISPNINFIYINKNMDPFIIKSHLKYNKNDDGYDSDCSAPAFFSPYEIDERILFFNNIDDLINDIIEFRNELISSN